MFKFLVIVNFSQIDRTNILIEAADVTEARQKIESMYAKRIVIGSIFRIDCDLT